MDNKIITGIDIGTTKIVAVIASYSISNNNEDIKILGIDLNQSHL